MNSSARTLFDQIPIQNYTEHFATLLQHKNIVIERIISYGQITPESQPYEQNQDEWVLLVQGMAKLKINTQIIHMTQGSYYFIPRHTPHWVTYTSKTPPTIWLAIHIYPQE